MLPNGRQLASASETVPSSSGIRRAAVWRQFKWAELSAISPSMRQVLASWIRGRLTLRRRLDRSKIPLLIHPKTNIVLVYTADMELATIAYGLHIKDEICYGYHRPTVLLGGLYLSMVRL